MVAIKDMEMPSCCGLCERYLLTCEYRFENAQTKRHPNCPLVEIEEPKTDGDCISRQAVLNLSRIKTHNEWGNVIKESVDVEDVKQLPPANVIERSKVKQAREEMYEEIADYENVQTEKFRISTGAIENSNTFGKLRGVTRTKNIVEKYMNKLIESEG